MQSDESAPRPPGKSEAVVEPATTPTAPSPNEVHNHYYVNVSGAEVGALAVGPGAAARSAKADPQEDDASDTVPYGDIFGGVYEVRNPGANSSSPEMHVLKMLEDASGECAATSYFKFWLQAPLNTLAEKPGCIAVGSIEPNDEDGFLERVRRHFPEDLAAVLGPPYDGRAMVENRPDGLKYHRRWLWWQQGVIGMAATLDDLCRPGVYSVADIAVDMLRLLSLVVDSSPRGVNDLPMGPVHLTLAIDPGTLCVAFDPSDRRARETLCAELRGVRSVYRPACTATHELRSEQATLMHLLANQPHEIVASLLIPMIKNFHQARIDTTAFVASLPPIMEAAAAARRL